MVVGDVIVDEGARVVVVASAPLVDESVEGAEVDTGVALLEGETCALFVDKVKLEEDANVLDVIGVFERVLEATVLLDVVVAVQNSCGTTL